jgi:NAD(P)-dependent dehydrogenase (short-subunit alcohol dehydrogenase family)
MAGRTAMVTGASSGIGLAAAAALGREGARVLMVCRSREKGEAARRQVLEDAPQAEAEVLLADLSVQSQVRGLAEELQRRDQPVHVLVNNAGIFEPQRRLSEDGIELTWATNVLAYHLLGELLLERLEASAPARVVNVASELAGGLELDDVQFERRTYRANSAYAQSKQADRMLTWSLARRLEGSGVTANAMHPGAVNTPLLARAMGGGSYGRTPEKGADTIVWLAASPEAEGLSGRFWVDRREVACRFRDPAQEERLRHLCDEMTAA